MGAHRGATIARRARLTGLVAALLSLLALTLSACGSSDSSENATPTATNVPAPTATAPLAANNPKTSVETAVSACRVKNGELLSRLVIGGVPDAELEALFALGIDVQLRSFTFPADEGDTVSVSVGLLIQRETGDEEVERTWELERTEDGWLFTSLPTCY